MNEIMGLGSWIVMGLVAGATAQYVVSGRKAAGCLVSLLVGVFGAVLGGLLSTALGFGGLSGFDIRSLIVATLGAVVVLLVLRLFKSRQ